jgi:transcriptional regulator with XRE-family HTH domain
VKDRIVQFLKSEGISPAEFADRIGVQRSSVSHVLNGRNHPSASFIQKFLGSYKTLNPRWLLLGEGTISDTKASAVGEPTLFQHVTGMETPKSARENVQTENNSIKEVSNQLSDNLKDKSSSVSNSNQQFESGLVQLSSDLVNASIENKEVDRIVFFYSDKTFAVYTPSK